MEKMNHEFFGELDLNGSDDGLGFSDGVIVLWEEEANGINTTLWYDKSFKIMTEMLYADEEAGKLLSFISAIAS
ncbi:TPA: hypothetical protein WIU21_000195 [Neisseria meningitidis]